MTSEIIERFLSASREAFSGFEGETLAELSGWLGLPSRLLDERVPIQGPRAKFPQDTLLTLLASFLPRTLLEQRAGRRVVLDGWSVLLEKLEREPRFGAEEERELRAVWGATQRLGETTYLEAVAFRLARADAGSRARFSALVLGWCADCPYDVELFSCLETLGEDGSAIEKHLRAAKGFASRKAEPSETLMVNGLEALASLKFPGGKGRAARVLCDLTRVHPELLSSLGSRACIVAAAPEVFWPYLLADPPVHDFDPSASLLFFLVLHDAALADRLDAMSDEQLDVLLTSPISPHHESRLKTQAKRNFSQALKALVARREVPWSREAHAALARYGVSGPTPPRAAPKAAAKAAPRAVSKGVSKTTAKAAPRAAKAASKAAPRASGKASGKAKATKARPAARKPPAKARA